MVKSQKGELLEGIMVQLIAAKNAVRTTVYSNADGRYEFPALDAGSYTLRIARPREFQPFVKEGVDIKGATRASRISRSTMSPIRTRCRRVPQIAAQMTGSEWLLSLSGTGAEKKLLTNNCNWCHSYQQIFRNHYDEAGWSKIVYRMIHGAGSPLININERGRWGGDEEARLVKWLASVRGPESKDPPFVMLPRPQGRPDPRRRHRIRTAAARDRDPRRDRRFQGQSVVLDPPQLLCRPARSSDRHRQGIPCAAGAGRRAARHPLDLRRQERHHLGLGELGAQHLAARSQDRGVHPHSVESARARQHADGRQLRASIRKASSGRRAIARSARSRR